jgi:uncharacterized protein (DUF885 family)
VTDVERARALADLYWDKLLEIDPLLGTECGDERFDDRLRDPSADGRERDREAHDDARRSLASIDRSALPASERGTMDLVEAIAARSLAEIEHRSDLLSVASHLWGPGQLLGEVASLQRADTPERIERYESRLRAFPAFLEASSELAREGMATGLTSPKVVVERAIAQVERLLAIPADGSPALAPVEGSDAETRERIVELVRGVVNPAHGRFLETLREYLPHATDTIGLSEIPGGAEAYAAQILAWTSLELDPGEVHELGLVRFESIRSERLDVAAGLGYRSPNEAIAARTASGDNTAKTPQELIALAEDQVQRSWEAASEWFGVLPSANCQVRAVEEFREADMAVAFYNAPTEDGSRPGIYYVNTFDLPSRALHQVAGITYHEANPGHHLQTAIEQEMPDRPALRRFGSLLAGSAFCEGWGLYSERLADEMGLYRDEWERLGMLDGQAHRAARLITDTGIHALGWTRDRAIATLESGGLPRTDAAIEVDRYIAIPGQALSYMIGMTEIEQARASQAAREGSAFRLRDFHDRVLALGQLPLPAFRREMA